MKILKEKKQKGEFGYLQYQRKVQIGKTVILFGVSLLLYVSGLIFFGSNKNLLTIVAVLGMLPASQYAVSVVMFLKAKSCSLSLYEFLNQQEMGTNELYDLFLTSYQNNFAISHVFYSKNTLIGFVEDENTNVEEAEKHLKTMFKMNDLSGVTIKLFLDRKQYLNRIEELSKLLDGDGKESEQKAEEKKATSVLDLCKLISL